MQEDLDTLSSRLTPSTPTRMRRYRIVIAGDEVTERIAGGNRQIAGCFHCRLHLVAVGVGQTVEQLGDRIAFLSCHYRYILLTSTSGEGERGEATPYARANLH